MTNEYKNEPLHIIFGIKKEYLRRKARCVVRGHKTCSIHLESYSSVAQSKSFWSLLTIDHKHKLKVMRGGARKAFPRASTEEKVNAGASEECMEK